jgi:hypothetical protein
MPIYNKTIKYYTCKFKCGHKSEPKHLMKAHEEKCFCNPKNKSCRICKNCQSGQHEMTCNEFGLYIINLENPKKVYDINGNIVWEIKDFPYEPLLYSNAKEFELIHKHNNSRPFPLTGCRKFILDKKQF